MVIQFYLEAKDHPLLIEAKEKKEKIILNKFIYDRLVKLTKTDSIGELYRKDVIIHQLKAELEITKEQLQATKAELEQKEKMCEVIKGKILRLPTQVHSQIPSVIDLKCDMNHFN